jgi:hypothetical protein
LRERPSASLDTATRTSLSRGDAAPDFGMSAVDEGGAVAGVVGIESGVVSEEFNLESSGVDAPDRRPRHDEHYHEA